jgi:hypothetical protein
MTTLRFKALVSGLVLSAAVLPAQERESGRPARSSTTVSKGILPDPLLLDGSKEAAEKIPEHGMLGEFELPGSENAKSDKVGGAQPEEQAAGGGAQQKQKDGGGSGAQAAQAAQDAAQQGGGGSEQKEGSGQGGQDGKQGQSQQGTASTGAQGAEGAKAEGIQAAGLSDPNGGAAAPQNQANTPPSNMKIGDAAMQIKTLPPGVASAVVGMEAQAKGKDTPQSYDAKTPGGGKQSTGRGNQGVERGKVMPPGL